MLQDMRLLSFVLFAALLSFSVTAKAQSVTDLRMMRNPNGQTRLVLDVSGAVPYRSFVLNNPPRVVIDLPNMGWTAPMNKGDRNGFVKSYRKGVFQKDTLRLVLELTKPLVVTSQQRIAPNKGNAWQYIFDLKPVDPIRFQQALNKVNTGGGADASATQNINDTASSTRSSSEAVAQKNLTMPGAKSQPTTMVTETTTTTTTTTTAPKTTLTAPKGHIPLIVVDAGHGGVDPGALASNGLYEKNITLAMAKEVKRQLEATGRYRVKLTRDTDIFIKLPDRVRIARNAGADMFISLHADTVPRPNVQGSSVYTLSETASDTETAKLAERENAVDTLVNVDVGHVDEDVADILIDLVTRDTMNQSKILAETVVGTFKQNGIRTLPQNPHRSAGFAVLKSPDVPSILIEMGFLSNRNEASALGTATYREQLSRAITRTVERYFSDTSKTAAY